MRFSASRRLALAATQRGEWPERVRGLGVEVAEAVGRQPAFSGLVREHADALAKARVEELVRQRTADIERVAHETTGKVEKLKKDLVALDKSYDEKKAAQENALAEERGEWLRKLTVREEAVSAREAGIDARQKEMATRLEDIIHRYETKGAEIGAEILTQVPILRRIGLSVGGEPQPETAGRLQLPAWFSRSRAAGQLSEKAFLAQFADVAERHGYVFSEEDLNAFHVAVKIGFWTVLAGPSGTGKTSLPRLYAEALGVADEFDSIAVRPDWLDDRDVVGAFNALAGRFEPAATGLVDRLIAAAEDLSIRRGGIYIVCLDEMNLARVEHYFAQFLSVLEEPAARRKLHLFSRGVERPGEPYAPWRELPIGENVRFVGTVNIDETTHFFSPKVLDRAPVLTFQAPAIDRAPSARSKAATIDVTPVRFDEYATWIRGPAAAGAGVGALLVAVDRTLRPIRSGLGFRLRDRVLSYVASAAGLLSEDRAFDLALSQSVLPRMRTNEPGFGDAVEALLGVLPEGRFPTTARLLGLMRESRGAHDFFHLLGS
jgi:hypothetical protein